MEERDDVEGLALYGRATLVTIATVADKRSSLVDLQIQTYWAVVLCKISAGV